MTIRLMPSRRARRAGLAAVAGLAFCLAGPPALSDTDPDAGQEQAAQVEPTAKERRRAAKEARIAEYLRKKEERQAQKDQRALSSARERQTAPPAAQPVTTVATETTPAAPREPAKRSRAPRRSGGGLPRELAEAQDAIRAASVGRDPSVQTYLDLIDRREASPQQLAAFGNFVAESGLPQQALAYYDVALRLEPDDSLLWTNYGTLNRQVGDRSAAVQAYQRALGLNSGNALAHYNLGAILDEQGKYSASLEAYKTALMLDPSLGDPAYNPQAANNSRLLAVKLLLYREQSGSLGLPLVDIPAETDDASTEDDLSALPR